MRTRLTNEQFFEVVSWPREDVKYFTELTETMERWHDGGLLPWKCQDALENYFGLSKVQITPLMEKWKPEWLKAV